jgi:purine-nucleoside phosphorylase
MLEDARASAAIVAEWAPFDQAEIGLVLGSGLGPIADDVGDRVAIPYLDLPGFPAGAGVSGHRGELVLGTIAQRHVAILSGRVHAYETGDAAAMRAPLETLALIGCHTLLLTNAAGSLSEAMRPGSLMIITDHINLAGRNPLLGEEGDARFVDLSAAYDPALREALRRAGERLGLTLREGVYLWLLGPSFETPAEIRMARMLGADAVGMSTVPEVIIARRLGLRVAAVSTITNLAAGLSGQTLSHAETKTVAAQALDTLKRLVHGFLDDDAV